MTVVHRFSGKHCLLGLVMRALAVPLSSDTTAEKGGRKLKAAALVARAHEAGSASTLEI
jgi:hypothetical protein